MPAFFFNRVTGDRGFTVEGGFYRGLGVDDGARTRCAVLSCSCRCCAAVLVLATRRVASSGTSSSGSGMEPCDASAWVPPPPPIRVENEIRAAEYVAMLVESW